MKNKLSMPPKKALNAMIREVADLIKGRTISIPVRANVSMQWIESREAEVIIGNYDCENYNELPLVKKFNKRIEAVCNKSDAWEKKYKDFRWMAVLDVAEKLLGKKRNADR